MKYSAKLTAAKDGLTRRSLALVKKALAAASASFLKFWEKTFGSSVKCQPTPASDKPRKVSYSYPRETELCLEKVQVQPIPQEPTTRPALKSCLAKKNVVLSGSARRPVKRVSFGNDLTHTYPDVRVYEVGRKMRGGKYTKGMLQHVESVVEGWIRHDDPVEIPKGRKPREEGARIVEIPCKGCCEVANDIYRFDMPTWWATASEKHHDFIQRTTPMPRCMEHSLFGLSESDISRITHGAHIIRESDEFDI